MCERLKSLQRVIRGMWHSAKTQRRWRSQPCAHLGKGVPPQRKQHVQRPWGRRVPGVKGQPGGRLHPPSHLKLRALFTPGPHPLRDSVMTSDFLSSSFLPSLLLSLFFLLFLHFHKKQMTVRKKVSCGPVPFTILRTVSSFSQGYEKALRCQVTEGRASVPERMSFGRQPALQTTPPLRAAPGDQGGPARGGGSGKHSCFYPVPSLACWIPSSLWKLAGRSWVTGTCGWKPRERKPDQVTQISGISPSKLLWLLSSQT